MGLLYSMREALDDPLVFGEALAGETWAAWRVVLIAARGEPLTPEEREIYRELTQREREPEQPCKELWAIVGRRGGKTRALSVAGAYMATCIDYTGRAAPGQRLRLPIVAAMKSQAKEAFNYIEGVFQSSTAMSPWLDGDPTADTIRLTNGVDISVGAANYRTVRSSTNVAVIADEMALWRGEDAANPDKEILRALRPGLMTTGGPLLVLSSPYAKRGELWETYRKEFGPEGDPRILVIKAPTLRMHDTPEAREEIDLEERRDPENARAEYGAEFRDTVSDLIDPETVAACVEAGVVSRARDPKTYGYRAFMDASGGGKDSMTLAIAHRKLGTNHAVLDHVEVIPPPVVPDVACARFATVLKDYGLYRVKGDAYAGNWPETLMRRQGITYDRSERNKSQIYLDFMALLRSRMCTLLDHPVVIKQLLALERRAKQGGRDVVDHPAGGHDDVINSAAGAMLEAAFSPATMEEWL